MIRVVFLAQLREQLGVAELNVEASAVSSVGELKQHLLRSHPEWARFLGNSALLVALNHEYTRGDVLLQPGDEVAFFPPVTGG